MILSAKHLSKSFSSPKPLSVLSDISLDASAGETIAICGRSGEGKTTLLHILGALEKPDSGELWIENTLVTPQKGPKLRQKYLGFIFQSYNLLEDFTALENVLMPSRIARQPLSPQKGLQLLEEVGLTERAHFPAKLLSGGERQRVAIARALCNNPSILLADEPTGNLDSAHAKQIGALLLACAKERQKVLILVTHDQDLASLCSRRYSLQNGKLQAI